MKNARCLAAGLALTAFTLAPSAQVECFQQVLTNGWFSTPEFTAGSMAAIDDWIVVGRRDDWNFTGDDAGSVFVFERQGDTWLDGQRVLPSDPATGGHFGTRVDIDGDTLVVTAGYGQDDLTAQGALYVFKLVAGSWTQVAKLAPPVPMTSTSYGSALSISNGRIVVGAQSDEVQGFTWAGAVLIYEEVAGIWTLVETLTANPPTQSGRFGIYADLSGDVLLVTAREHPVSGSTSERSTVFIYRRDLTGWILEESINSQDLDVSSEAMIPRVDGDRIGISNPTNQDGQIDLFRYSNNVWNHEETLVGVSSSYDFGASFELMGDMLLVGVPGGSFGGWTYLYEFINGHWAQTSDFLYDPYSGSNEGTDFGTSVAFVNGGRSVVSARRLAEVAVWQRPGHRWSYGAATPGTSGLPRLGGQGCMAPEFAQSLSVTNGPIFGSGLLLVTDAPGAIPFIGGTLLVGGSMFTSALHTLNFVGSVALPFTLNTSMYGQSFYCQSLYADPGAPAGVSMTNGLRLDVF